MSSSFKGLDLFGSGPHRFAAAPRGQLVTNDFNFSGGPGSTPQGLIDWKIIVSGRLVAAGESALNTLRDALLAQLEHTPTPGTLIDTHGRTWSDMSLVTITEADRIDRAREWSLAYIVTFQHL